MSFCSSQTPGFAGAVAPRPRLDHGHAVFLSCVKVQVEDIAPASTGRAQAP